ncbi:hypothetical protein GCM10008179_13830 [Hansschlegelia plantiphila]|uniref:Uncharacterized protein n=1 Tax=Hansschlegelia plantiphila TaxID=374655 RepID=A0A9W6J1W8_9HYPH|nr:hypothetical protein GCM10008179_13830 [Hansschlegelia plantiphila]
MTFGADLDLPDDAVGAREGRDLDAVGLAHRPLDHARQVDGLIVRLERKRLQRGRRPYGPGEGGRDDERLKEGAEKTQRLSSP